MSDPLLDKVREQIDAQLERRDELLAVALQLARREGWSAGELGREAVTGRKRFPLPTRTREVLREEPVSGVGASCLFRCRDGVLERQCSIPKGLSRSKRCGSERLSRCRPRT
jgi:hypothetical protein